MHLDHVRNAAHPGAAGADAVGTVARSPLVRGLSAVGAGVGRWILSMKITTKISFVLLVCITVPLGGTLVMLHERMFKAAEAWAVFGVVLSLILLVPLAKFIAWVVVLKDVRQVNDLCLQVRSGNYKGAIPLPPEGEDEHEILRLKRNLNWMVHAIACREEWLQCRLDETAEHKKRFETLSMVDELTGIYNRRFFEEHLAEAADKADRLRRGFYLMLLDCDHFKDVNDTLGHAAGDELLRRLGEILKTSLRGSTDCPFRYGGDEFGVIFGDMPQERVMDVAERIRSRFMDERVGKATLSMGIARYEPGKGNGAEPPVVRLRREADAALYQAKAEGRNKVVFADELDAGAARRRREKCPCMGK